MTSHSFLSSMFLFADNPFRDFFLDDQKRTDTRSRKGCCFSELMFWVVFVYMTRIIDMTMSKSSIAIHVRPQKFMIRLI